MGHNVYVSGGSDRAAREVQLLSLVGQKLFQFLTSSAVLERSCPEQVGRPRPCKKIPERRLRLVKSCGVVYG